MPISKTGGIKTGELRLFEVQGLKIKIRYKIICHFHYIQNDRLTCHEGYQSVSHANDSDQ